MEINEVKDALYERLASSERTLSFDEETNELRVERTLDGEGVTLDVSKVHDKYQSAGEQALEDMVIYIDSTFQAMDQPKQLSGQTARLYPVIRSTSFPTEAPSGRELLYDEHTAETRVYYALDLGSTYTLIDEGMVEQEGLEAGQVKETARFNVRRLPVEMNEDEVAGNRFYFINTNDGYDASRILNDKLLADTAQQIEGDMTVAVPHQDVLIIGDIRNEQGYDVLGQMAFRFFTNGRIPVTALPMIYEDGTLDPIFIMARKKPKS
ncbi:uncharacterized protein YtpQ (UPF0354 family) [Salsuginibacillus halophilus]|uniref:Uncharacterized protein YtpQ (UPF0354 family) n=1 Tax=Salsuginibacillus halophilus TaxID=517424 RepID=A0A2P8HEA6_9BACI|nr:DUF1444 family protein [Salsuginibacillus halophilus]PSL44539.1 uncharacterized protein YtpQ (UPF0354 family) [Salsuginibacillus halophilus]